ncbi:MAG: PaaI family thioesterase [Bilophila sp.]
MFAAIKKRVETKDRLANLLGITVIAAGHGYGKTSMPFTDNLRNPVDALHGGAIFTLADVAFGVASNFGESDVMVTTTSSISFIKMAQSGPIVAEVRRVNGGKRMGTFSAQVVDGEGTIIATALLSGYRLDVPIKN